VASFPPFKAYILATLDELIERHRLTGPFLDLGCGRGDVAVHLARRGWSGMAVDAAPVVRALASAALAAYPQVQVGAALPDGERFNTVLLMDVLEHVADDRGTLLALAARQPPHGALVATVPSNQEREWRWDDEVYGHLRRYGPSACTAVLEAAGYRVVEMWDVSFPFFWLLRRGFTAIKRSPTVAGTPEERSARSATTEAWDLPVIGRLLSHPALWRPAFALQRRFRGRPERGAEMIVLARRVMP